MSDQNRGPEGYSPPQGYSQPGAPQQGYSQPGAPQQGYSPQAYQPQPGYYAPQAYQPGPYQTSGYGGPKPPKSPILGYVSLGLAVLGSVLFAVPMRIIDLSELMAMAQAGGEINAEAVSQTMMNQMLLFTVGGLIVFIGFVLSIVAIATNAGRVFGIIALISCIVLPWVLFYVFMVTNPTLPAVPPR